MCVKALPHWKWENPAAKSSPVSENACIESKHDCATEIEEPEGESTDESSPLGM